MSRALYLTLALSFPLLSSSYSWTFGSTPEQCQNVSISITGSDGKPPYSVLIIPSGPSPLPNNIEARTIVDQSFPGSSTSVSFQLKYPTDSQFIAVVSDSNGFGSGGTSVVATVLGSSDSSCFNATQSVVAPWVFNINPPNQIIQCNATRLWWDPTQVQGNPAFLGVIPGGQSFPIPNSTVSTVPQEGVGFNWTPNIRGGTTFVLVAGDNRGAGSGGSVPFEVGFGANPDNSCLSNSSPSSTPGSPAGGSYPTSTSGANTGGGSGGGSSNNTGAIIGGVIGGVTFLIALGLVLLFFYRRKRLHKAQKERPDLLQGGEDDGEEANGRNQPNELPQYYQPEPFMVPDPTLGSSSQDGHTVEGGLRPLSGVTSTSRSGTPDPNTGGTTTSASGRKGGYRPMRPVNIIQHDDAGPSTEAPKDEEEPEIVELPPAYTNIRKAEPAP